MADSNTTPDRVQHRHTAGTGWCDGEFDHYSEYGGQVNTCNLCGERIFGPYRPSGLVETGEKLRFADSDDVWVVTDCRDVHTGIYVHAEVAERMMTRGTYLTGPGCIHDWERVDA